MLDKFVIFSKSGVVLWTKVFEPVAGDPVNDLIRHVLLEERSKQDKKYSNENYMMRWIVNNDLELVFVALHPKGLNLEYIDNLLDKISESFCSEYMDVLRDQRSESYLADYDFNFTEQFDEIRREVEQEYEDSKKRATVQRKFTETSRGQEISKVSTKKPKKPSKKPEPVKVESPKEIPKEASPTVEKLTSAKLSEIARKRGFGSRSKKDTPSPSAPVKKQKPRRNWDEGAPIDGPLSRVDKTEKNEAKAIESMATEFAAGTATDLDDWSHLVNTKNEESSEEYSEDESSEEEVQEKKKTITKKKSGWLGIGGLWEGLTNRVLTSTDLEPVLTKFKEILIEKNVASEIAEDLCHSVGVKLEGKKLSSFTRIQSTVRTALEEALTRILTPKRNIDMLNDAKKVKRTEKRPYTVVFVGVNGVGKSTNLAKVCNYLTQEKLKVLICACDTFRSGAVEQLKTHARCLKVDLFEQGYVKDPALVAQNGVAKAAREGYDVVLIDTAGRMQNNTPLMVALAKLVYLNNPDLILFVGEALVGNEAVDQLRNFNRALEEFAPNTVTKPRLIDGIILSKFDTVDKKVGAAISMTHITGQPIVFVGTGQKYPDLKRMNAAPIIQALLG